MSRTPKELLERLSHEVTLLPGLSEHEIAQFQEQLPRLLPDEIRQLFLYSSGFAHPLLGTVRFNGVAGGVEFPLLPSSVSLLGDGCGNFWVADINVSNGVWGPIFFVCHDPPVIAIQARDLADFLSQILLPEETDPTEALKYVQKEAVTKIWMDDPWLTSVDEARRAQDHAVSKFAGQLPDNFRIADLRSTKVGSGFSWGKAGPDADIRRYGSELIFGVEQRAPGFLTRMFSKRP